MKQVDKYALLNSLSSRGIHYDLGAMAAASEKRGHPERRVRSIIVAGTNGKGSTSAMLHAMLRALGYRVGLYTSPHLIDVRERIRIDDWIPLDAFAFWLGRYEAEGLLAGLTYYEALTLLAFDWFAEEKVDWAILEVGVGGRLDAVNLSPAEGAVITSIDYDHCELLGDTLAAIAGEKAGVIKPGRPVVHGRLPDEALGVIEAAAARHSSPVFAAGTAFDVRPSGAGWVYDGRGALVVPELGLRGAHQASNLGCAVAALEHIVGIDPASCADQLRAALRQVSWKARFQVISAAPLIVLDGAHNPAGARALTAAFRKFYGGRRPTVVFGSLREKDHRGMLAALRELSDEFWLIQVPEQERALPLHQLRATPELEGARVTTWTPDDLLRSLHAADEDSAFVVTGSVAFAGWFLGEWAPANQAP